MIARALLSEGFFSTYEESIVFNERPRGDRKTFDLLKNRTIEHPSRIHSIDQLEYVWAVKERHKDNCTFHRKCKIARFPIVTAKKVTK